MSFIGELRHYQCPECKQMVQTYSSDCELLVDCLKCKLKMIRPMLLFVETGAITPEMMRDLQKPGKIVFHRWLGPEDRPFGPESYERMHPELGQYTDVPLRYDDEETRIRFATHHRTCGLRRGSTYCTCGPTT